MTLNDGLDSLCTTALATSGAVSKGTFDVLNAIRRAVTAVTAGGYFAEPVGDRRRGFRRCSICSATVPALGAYAFGPGRFSPGQLFGLDVRVTKAAGTAVIDTSAYGRLYVSPIRLARFEENAGATNTSTVRLEGNGVFGTERTAAAARVMP